MSGFDERGDGFEGRFAHDEVLAFKVKARRNKMLGIWAAEKTGLSSKDADVFVEKLTQEVLKSSDDDNLFAILRKSFDAKDVALSDHQIRRTMDEMLVTAKQQIQNDEAG